MYIGVWFWPQQLHYWKEQCLSNVNGKRLWAHHTFDDAKEKTTRCVAKPGDSQSIQGVKQGLVYKINVFMKL